MHIRKTARVLLFDWQNRLLLIRMHDPAVGGADGVVLRDPYWVTVGGEMEPGEDVAAAAKRELAEETGLSDVRFGPPVWTSELVLCVHGKNQMLQQVFLPAWTEATELSRDAWTELERQVILDLKWWRLDELQATTDTIFPTSLVQHIPALMAGDIPAFPFAVAP
tara:strand:- start:8121 stop:8615 length:495 start_codon:yes stop_codon:yes gene_type:complete